MKNIVLMVVLAIVSSTSVAAEQTYLREYTYQASEADSKISARAIALQQVKNELLSELGTHVSALVKQQSSSDGRQLGTVEIETLSAGVTSLQILSEKWDGVTYVLKAQIKADPAEVLINLNKMLDVDKKQKENSQLTGELSKLSSQNIQIAESLTQSRMETDAALAEIARLKKQLAEKQTDASRQLLNTAYHKQTTSLKLNELVDSGLQYYGNEKYSDAIKLFKEAALQGNVIAQTNLGVMYGSGQGVPQNNADALKWFRLAAQHGDALAQSNLGVMYELGKGVPQDYAEAMTWYRLAAHQGNDSAQSNLGMMYGLGKGVPQDYAEAMNWYQLAAQQGNVLAQTNLGVMYARGQGVPQDYAEAEKWFRLAAEQGLAYAQARLGTMHDKGQGVPQDYAEAVKWYRLSAQQGNAEAQARLGFMYALGRGVPHDYVKTYLWFNLSAAAGEAQAISLRDKAAKQMTPAQIVKAQKMASECIANKLQGCN